MPIISLLLFAGNLSAYSIPNICTIVKAPNFRSLMNIRYQVTFCGFPPIPCVNIRYHIPRYFIEVVSKPKTSAFKKLPSAALQLSGVTNVMPSGVDDDNGSYSYDAHTIRIPLASYILSGLPCYQSMLDLSCFSSMSEHLGQKWKTGSADSLQPSFLAWSISPKACVTKGSLTSVTGNLSNGNPGIDAGICSVPTPFLPKYLPSSYPVCTGWGIHFPRSGTVTSSDALNGSLMIASRIKSIGAENLQSFKTTHDDKWQMVKPNISTTFREGQNAGILAGMGINERGRLKEISSSYIYAIWQPMACTRKITAMAQMEIWINSVIAACKGF